MDIGVNWVDVAVLVLLIVGTAVGLFQGLINQTCFIAATYVSVVLSAQYYRFLASWLRYMFPDGASSILNLVALGLIFMISCLALNVLIHALGRTDEILPTATIDHLGGALFGALAMWVVIAFTLGMLQVSLKATWIGWEDVRRDLELAANGSVFSVSAQATLPWLNEIIKPWLPSGLPLLLMG